MTSQEDGPFSFETPHLALRGNADYMKVLNTIAILEAQQKQAHKNYQKVVQLKNEYVEDPVMCVEKIMKGEDLGLPPRLNIPELPVIDWTKYNVKIPEDLLKSIYSETSEPPSQPEVKQEVKIKKSVWTTEEQQRLEELLAKYPSEPVEMNRFRKIAKALGNRSVQQVTSRVQKFFMKLVKHGLPIPGRTPKAAERIKRTSLHKHQRHNHFLWRPTTFFPKLSVPFVTDEMENAPGPSSMSFDAEMSSSTGENYLLNKDAYNEERREDDVKAQLELLKRVREGKIRELRIGNPFQHLGFQCNHCGDDPIVGTRWHCLTCEDTSVDFCTDCILDQMCNSKLPHPPSHQFVAYIDDKTPLFQDDCDSDSEEKVDSIKDEMTDAEDDGMSSENHTVKAERTSESSGSVLDEIAIKQEATSVKDDLEEVDYEDAEQALFNSTRSPQWFNELSRLSPDFLNSGSIFADSD